MERKVLTLTIEDGKLSHLYEGPWTRRDLEMAYKQCLLGLPEYLRNIRRQEEKANAKKSKRDSKSVL